MIIPDQIVDAIGVALAEKFPKDSIYKNYVPQNFQRPAFAIEMESLAMKRDSTGTVEVVAQLTIRSIVQNDVYNHSHFAESAKRQFATMGLFAPGSFRVADRSLAVVKLEGDGGYDFANVSVAMAWAEDLCDFVNFVPYDTVETVDVGMAVASEN